MSRYIAIIAQDPNGVIGMENDIPWKLPEDLKFFKEMTSGHTIVMGRKTFESIGSKPLPKRRNIVLSKTLDPNDLPEGVELYKDVVEIPFGGNIHETTFIIGGAAIYREYVWRDVLDGVLITHVNKPYLGDTYSPFSPKLLERRFPFCYDVWVTKKFVVRHHTHFRVGDEEKIIYPK